MKVSVGDRLQIKAAVQGWRSDPAKVWQQQQSYRRIGVPAHVSCCRRCTLSTSKSSEPQQRKKQNGSALQRQPLKRSDGAMRRQLPPRRRCVTGGYCEFVQAFVLDLKSSRVRQQAAEAAAAKKAQEEAAAAQKKVCDGLLL